MMRGSGFFDDMVQFPVIFVFLGFGKWCKLKEFGGILKIVGESLWCSSLQKSEIEMILKIQLLLFFSNFKKIENGKLKKNQKSAILFDLCD